MSRAMMAVAGLALLVCATQAGATTVVLTFEGLADQEQVLDYYNGGGGGSYGISFSDNALAVIDSDAGGTGNFGHEPSPDTIMFFLTGTAATMNVPAGFDTGFSFYYTSINQIGQIVVYDDVDATGTVLTTLALPVTPQDGGDPNGSFSPLVPIGVAFTGIAKSVDFAGTINQIGFDNITLGAETPGGVVPEPLTCLGLVMGAGGLVGYLRKRRR